MPDVRRSAAATRRSTLVVALAGLAVAAGVVLLVVGLRGQESVPVTRDIGSVSAPAAAPAPSQPGSSPTTPAPVTPTAKPPLGRSLPVRIRIPAIGVDSAVNRLGLAADGSLAVPQPGPHEDEAAWFENSPTPGQVGPAIIEGHVDTRSGPSVFLRLADLRPGDRILVDRADGRRLTFTVDGLRDFAKESFPTRVVYGGDLSRPQLRLITCSDFDASIGHHTGNTVVFSHLTSVSRSRS